MATTLLDLAVKVSAQGVGQTEAALAGLEGRAASAEKSIGGRMRSIGSSMQRVGGAMSTFITVPAGIAGGAMVKLASDAEETGSKFQTVFGKQTSSMNRWVTDLMKTMPATRQEIQGMAAGIQDLLVPIGVAPRKAQDMTKSIVELTGDLASFNNLPTADVSRDIQAALTGEYDSMKKYGVALNAAAVERKAYTMGIAEEGEELTAAQKAQAAYAIILEDTKAAQGDMARTADSAANSFRFLWRDVKELGTAMGSLLLPVLVPIVQKLTVLAGWLMKMPAPVQAVVLGIGLFAAALGPLIFVIGTLITSFGAIIGLIGTLGITFGGILAVAAPVIAAIAGIGLAAAVIYKNWDRIKQAAAPLRSALATVKNAFTVLKAVMTGSATDTKAVQAAWNALPGWAQNAVRGIIMRWMQLRHWWAGFWVQIRGVAQPILSAIANIIRSVLGGALDFLRGNVRIVVNFFRQNMGLMQKTATTILRGLGILFRTTFNAIRAIVMTVVRFVVAFWRQNHNQLRSIAMSVWRIISTIIRTALRVVLQLVRLGMQLITGDWRGAWQTIQNIGRIVWNAIQVIVRNALNIIKNVIQVALNVIRGIWESVLRAIREWVQGFANNVRSIFTSLADFAKNLWRTAWDAIRGTWESSTSRIREWVSGWRDNLKSIFNNLKDGIWDAMKSIGRALWEPIEAGWDKAKQIWNTIVDAISGILKRLGDPGGFGKKLEGAKFAEGGVREGSSGRSPKRSGRLAYAEGGVRGRGYVTSDTYLVGEDLAPGEREYILTESKKGKRAHRNGRLWEEYGRRNGLLPNDRGRPRMPEGRGLDRIPRFARGGSRAGNAPYGTHWDVYDFIKKRADEIVGKHGGTWNSYDGHISTAPANEHSTVDFWDPGGRGDYITYSRGDAINRDIHSNYRQGLIDSAWDYKLWRADGSTIPLSSAAYSSDPHIDHVHVAWSPDPNAKIVSGSGGDGGFNPIAAAYDKIVQPIVDRFLKAIDGDYVMRKMLHAGGTMFTDGVREAIVGSSSGGSNEGTVKDMIRRGLEMGNAFPATQANIDEMYSRAMQESGGDTKAINLWDSNAAAGTPSKGLFQIIEPTWETWRKEYGADMGSFDENWGFGDKSAAVASRYMRGVYGEIVGATGVGYTDGGMPIKPHNALVEPHDLFLPLDNQRVMQSAQTALGTAELRATFEREISDMKNTLAAALKQVELGARTTETIERGQTRVTRQTMESTAGRDIISRQSNRIDLVSRSRGMG